MLAGLSSERALVAKVVAELRRLLVTLRKGLGVSSFECGKRLSAPCMRPFLHENFPLLYGRLYSVNFS